MAKYYQPEIETASREQIKAWQDERLVKQVQHVWDNVPYYRKKMEEKGLTPADIQSTADLHKLPFLTKNDLREAYPYGLAGKPMSECVRIHSTSGTTGKRVVAFYTQQDVDLWEDCCARAITAVGGTEEDVCHFYHDTSILLQSYDKRHLLSPHLHKQLQDTNHNKYVLPVPFLSSALPYLLFLQLFSA